MSEYIQEKIKLLKQLKIKMNAAQIKHIKSLQTEIQVDNYAHDLIFGNGAAPYEVGVFNLQTNYLGTKRAIRI